MPIATVKPPTSNISNVQSLATSSREPKATADRFENALLQARKPKPKAEPRESEPANKSRKIDKATKSDASRKSEPTNKKDKIASDETDPIEESETVKSSSKTDEVAKTKQPKRDDSEDDIPIDEQTESAPEAGAPLPVEVVDPDGESPPEESSQQQPDKKESPEDQSTELAIDPALLQSQVAGAEATQPVAPDTKEVAATKGQPATKAVATIGTQIEAAQNANGEQDPSTANPSTAGGTIALPDAGASANEVFDDELIAEAPVASKAEGSDSTASSSNVAQLNGPSAFSKTLDKIVEAKAQPAASPEAQFIEQNRDEIVTNVKTQLLPNGGTMRLRLDPPELGALQVSVTIKNGVMTASFETNNDEATRMLSHSLSDLKTALESSGVVVERMQVQQAPRETTTQSNSRDARDGSNQQPHWEGPREQQEQQRREMLRRMWARVTDGSDPLDLVA